MPKLNLESLGAVEMGQNPYETLGDAFQQEDVQEAIERNKKEILSSPLDTKSSQSIQVSSFTRRRRIRAAAIREQIAAGGEHTYVASALQEMKASSF